MKLYRITRPLFGGMALPAPFLALSADSTERVLAWVGYGITFAVLSLMSAVATRKE